MRSSVFRVRRPRDFRSVDRRSIRPKLMVRIKFFLACEGGHTSSATTKPTSFFVERLSILYLLSGFVNRYTGLKQNLCRVGAIFFAPTRISFSYLLLVSPSYFKTAFILLTPEDELSSLTISKCPSSAVFAACGPPQICLSTPAIV